MGIVDFTTGRLLELASIGDSPDAAAFDAKSVLAFSSNGGDGSLSVVDTTKAKFPSVQTLKTTKGARTMAFNASNGKIYIAAAQLGAAPAATAAMPHPRPSILPESFEIIVVEK
jgi:DNA-binding beta-propeller fold protein YncE